MAKTFAITYVVFFLIGIFTIVLTRLILILRLYAIKDSKVFGSSAENEILSFLASITLPFKLTEEPKNQKTDRIIKILNKLKTAYWWLMLTFVIFIIALNILENGLDNKIFD